MVLINDKTGSKDKKYTDLFRQVNYPTIYYDSIISKTSSELNSKPKLKLFHRNNITNWQITVLKMDLLFSFHCWFLVHRRLAENKNWAILPTWNESTKCTVNIYSLIFSVCIQTYFQDTTNVFQEQWEQTLKQTKQLNSACCIQCNLSRA